MKRQARIADTGIRNLPGLLRSDEDDIGGR
jgi:hypothetical protein